MLLRTKLVWSLYLPLVGALLNGCGQTSNDPESLLNDTVTGIGGNVACNCTGKCRSSTLVGPANADAEGGTANTDNTTISASQGGVSNVNQTNRVGDSSGGNTSTGGYSGRGECTDTPRSNESCKDAVQWGFCPQDWFAGYCEASCGKCTLGTGGSGNSNPSASAGGNGNIPIGTSTTGISACTDSPRASESCKDAVQWGFCQQDWFAGNCDASCGKCSMNASGSGGKPSTSNTNANTSTGGSISSSSTNASASTGGRNASSTSATGGTTSTTMPVGDRVDNPYVGVTGYVNPEWKAKADTESGGSRVSNNPTGVWMDRIAAIDGTGSSATMGMRDHLDEALTQGAGYIQFVIYNLPGRDCAALSSNGELGPTDIDRYETEYIDPIAAIEGDSKYAALRIINIIEIDSLPNLVTNTGSSETATAACDVMKANGNYQKGIQYALSQLHKIGNTYNYIDAGHHGWIGWDNNFNDSAALFSETVKGAEGGYDTVTGFITNTANYSALSEPYLTVTDATRKSDWIDWNRYVDETTFAKAFRTKLVALGFSSSIGMLIDTSRNGWGGPARPTAASTATDVNTMVNDSRMDRRIHPGNWCNQSGAGLGERPKAVDSDGIDAYVWIKPPGESDGASQYVENDQGKGFDGMCDPTYAGNARNGNSMSGALPDAPLAGAWFSAQFQELMKNAYPVLQ
jgi:cellulose 1,4-beta-cellobiosidase